MADAITNPRINRMLRVARERAGVSLEEAATHLGVTTATLSRVETATLGVSADRLERLCRFYDVSIGSLFDGELVRMPTSIDIDRLKATVHLVQSVIHQRKVKPSPDKVAEIVSTVFTNEVRWLIDNPDSDTAFDPERHRGFVEMVLKK